MAKLKHLTTLENWYFVTTSLRKPLRLFERPSNANIFLDVLFARLNDGDFRVDEFVAMPDHVHFIVIPIRKHLSRIVGEIKRGTTRIVNSKDGIFQ
ncbi:MAG: transposase, partial [Candidatus Electryoneaceae bacterium]|nr:transposase [Candidatus Electryoneaceae bacterium]